MTIRRITWVAVLLCTVWAVPAQAQCSGSGMSFNCAAGSTPAQVQTAINSAANGATITLAAGTYNWSGNVIQLSVSNGVTLICASAPASGPPWGASTASPCTVNTSNTIFETGGFPNNTNLYRISGFTFNQGSNGFLIDLCAGGGCSGTMGQLRVDHNTFNLATGGVALFFGDSAAANLHAYGVMDHNQVKGAGSVFALETISTAFATPTASPLGTGSNFFLEDNFITITTLTNSGSGCTDGWGPSFAIVLRHNTAVNCRWLTHGLGDGGGPDNFEIYNNSTTYNSGASGSGVEDCFRFVHDQGAGTLMVYNNVCTPLTTDNPSAMVFQNFRDCGNGPSCNEGNKPPACDGTVVNAIYPGTSVPFSDGNRSPSSTWFGYPCWHQPSRDESGNYKPMYAWNNAFGDGTQANLVYNGNAGVPPPACTAGPSGNCSYDTIHDLPNREYYNAVSVSAQTSPILPFNGTVGVGFGTLANRPPTCTTSTETAFGKGAAGVGYFATDQGPQGTLYTCSATDTWSVYYTPFFYPHPLVAGGGNPPQPPTGPAGIPH